MRLFTLILSISFLPLSMLADAYQDYIDRYAPMAVEQQLAHGIPA